MRTSFRIVACALALAAASMFLSACDASPYAASVNGRVIKQLTLQRRLSEFIANKAFVTAQDSASASASGGTGITGAGGSGTYTSAFTADVLGQMVVESIVHQYLAARGDLPTATMVAAARGVYQAGSGSYWYGFPPELRSFLAQFLAEQAAVIAPSTDTATLQQGYAQFEKYMFTQVCLRQASAFDQAQAQSLVSSGVASGTKICYDQAELEAQSEAMRNAVVDLSVGEVTKPVETGYGFVVAKLVSRRAVPLDLDTRKVLTLVYDSQNGTALTAIGKIISAASVKVNPQFGTWNASAGSVTPPAGPTTS